MYSKPGETGNIFYLEVYQQLEVPNRGNAVIVNHQKIAKNVTNFS